MSEVFTRDILLRVGGRTLARYGTPVWRRTPIARGGEENKEIFTRATVKRPFRDRDGFGRKAAAGNLAIDWPTGLVDAAGNPMGGLRIDGARTQLVTDPENFGNWTKVSTPTVTGGQADPFGGTNAYNIDNSIPSVASRFITEAVAFAGDAVKAVELYVRKGAVSAASGSRLNIQDTTAVADRLFAVLTWSGNTPSLAVSTGTFLGQESWTGNWWRLLFQTTSITAANSHLFRILPSTTGTEACDLNLFGANAWNAAFPSSYQGPGESAGVADSFTMPFNFGPMDLTVLARLARPLHADATGVLGLSPRFCELGNGPPRLVCYFDGTSRLVVAQIDTAGTDATSTAAIPAGAVINVLAQFKNLTTGGQVALDVGSGLGAFSSPATGFAAFLNQQLLLGASAGSELYGVLGDLIIARGLFTKAELEAVP
jgi:hypothetical protein